MVIVGGHPFQTSCTVVSSLKNNWKVVIRMKDGILVEHWDVIQDEAPREQSKSGSPMFGDTFPK